MVVLVPPVLVGDGEVDGVVLPVANEMLNLSFRIIFGSARNIC